MRERKRRLETNIERLKALFARSQGELNAEEQRAVERIVARTQRAAGDIAVASGLDAVYDEDGGVLWARSGVDASAAEMRDRSKVDLGPEIIARVDVP